MFCTEIYCVGLHASAFAPLWYSNVTQEPKRSPVVFESALKLKLSELATDKLFAKVTPEAMQEAIRILNSTRGGAFSVQQLLLDLISAALSEAQANIFTGLDPPNFAYQSIERYFINDCWEQQQKAGERVLRYHVKVPGAAPASLALRNIDMMSQPLLGPDGAAYATLTAAQARTSTLCYLGVARSNVVPSASRFTWRRGEENEADQFHDIVSIGHAAMADWLNSHVKSQLLVNCTDFDVDPDLPSPQEFMF